MGEEGEAWAGGSGPWVSQTPRERVPWGSGREPSLLISLGCSGTLSIQALLSRPLRAPLCVRPLQVLHQVLAVAGLPRVPEEHDVWSEVQALQVMGEGGRGGRGPASYLSFSHSPTPGLLTLGQVRVQRVPLNLRFMIPFSAPRSEQPSPRRGTEHQAGHSQRRDHLRWALKDVQKFARWTRRSSEMSLTF